MLLADRNLQISGSVPGRTFPAKFRRNPVSDTQCYKMLFPIRAMNLLIMLRCETTYNTAKRAKLNRVAGRLKAKLVNSGKDVQCWPTSDTIDVTRTCDHHTIEKPRCWFTRCPCLRGDAQRIPFALIFVISLQCCAQYRYLGV
jgi:hypothetical protein